MALATYADLQTALSTWLDGSDLSSQQTTLIALAEAEITDRLGELVDQGAVIGPMITRGALAITASEYLALPDSNLLLPIAIEVTSYSDPWQIEYISPDALLQLKIDGGTGYDTSVPPQNYTVEGSYLRFWPTPSAAWTAEYTRYDKLPALSNSNSTNWLLTNHPNVYLYGSLAQAELMGWNDSRVANLATLFENAMAKMAARYPAPANQAHLRSEISLLGRNSRNGLTSAQFSAGTF
jgi:hypothetical protein